MLALPELCSSSTTTDYIEHVLLCDSKCLEQKSFQLSFFYEFIFTHILKLENRFFVFCLLKKFNSPSSACTTGDWTAFLKVNLLFFGNTLKGGIL